MVRDHSYPRDSEPRPRAIVLHGRSLMSLVIAHSLSRHGVEVIGADDVELTVLSFSRHVKRTFVYPPLAGDTESFLAGLEEKVRRFKPEDGRPYLLMPVFRETDLIAQHRARFERHAAVAAPPFEAIAQVHPKDRLAATARRLGLHTPATSHPASEEDLLRLLPELKFPVMIKPTNDMGGRGVVACAHERGLIESYRAFKRQRGESPLVQERVSGSDYCMTVLADHGTVRASMAYRNLQKFPPDAGAGVARETVDDSPFLPAVRRLFGEVGWHGIAQVDFHWNGRLDSEPYLIEVNPRFWLGLFHSVESGVDFPWLLYQLTIEGRTDEAPAPQLGKRTKTPGLWLMSAVRDIAASDESYRTLAARWHDSEDRVPIKGMRARLEGLAEDAAATKPREMLGRLRSVIQQGRTAKNDLFFRDDPFVVLGVLFVLASLIRHRRLPSEKNR